MVRELHVYGSVVPVSARDPGKFQHRGFGTLLMEEAERIARDEHGATKLAVISGESLSSQQAWRLCSAVSKLGCLNLLSRKNSLTRNKRQSLYPTRYSAKSPLTVRWTMYIHMTSARTKGRVRFDPSKDELRLGRLHEFHTAKQYLW